MINLNFLPFKHQELSVKVFRKLHSGERVKGAYYHYFFDEANNRELYEIKFQPDVTFETYLIPPYKDSSLVAKSIYNRLVASLPNTEFFIRHDDFKNKKIHFILDRHPKGRKCVWVEPYFLKSKQLWGLLVDYNFVVDGEKDNNKRFKLDKEILIASGSLNAQGNSNIDYFIFKHDNIAKFLKRFLSTLNSILVETVGSELLGVESSQLDSKNYLFANGSSSTSSYMGLTKNPPLKKISEEVKFYFIYKKDNRDTAVSLLKGLRGESNPTTFGGMEKLFGMKFTNELIKGTAVNDFDEATIEKEINNIRELGKSVIPIIITNSKKEEEDERLYFWLKHKFTNEGIPCQVVTKDLIRNEYSLKYSLSNIGLQIFAKAGGQPWKMKSANPEYLIIGIGQSYNIGRDEASSKIEKNIAYSVLTDSSGIFKDIQVLGEGIEDENYYNQLVANLVKIITTSSYKKVSIHCPFRMSKSKVFEKVIAKIPEDIELTVLVINNKSDFFGFDYNNNGLVPFESTYIKLAPNDFLVWFEGLQYNNPKINKRFGNPLLITFWYTNKPSLYNDFKYKESLLQDCINLSGANWRGFKAKQLPVSVFYCQRIAEFIGKFKQYNLEHIEISNLKPWFL